MKRICHIITGSKEISPPDFYQKCWFLLTLQELRNLALNIEFEEAEEKSN